jgi:hypothetical protein
MVGATFAALGYWLIIGFLFFYGAQSGKGMHVLGASVSVLGTDGPMVTADVNTALAVVAVAAVVGAAAFALQAVNAARRAA